MPEIKGYQPTVLIADTDWDVTEILKKTLLQRELLVVNCQTADSTLERLRAKFSPELLIYDPRNLHLPIRVVREVSGLPIIVLEQETSPITTSQVQFPRGQIITSTPLTQDEEHMIRSRAFKATLALDEGAQSYQTKPFNPDQMADLAWSIIRRYQFKRELDRIVRTGVLQFNVTGNLVLKNGQLVGLNGQELRLGMTFATHLDQPLTSPEIASLTWGINKEELSKNFVANYVYRLRQKLEDDPQNPTYLVTQKNAYILRALC